MKKFILVFVVLCTNVLIAQTRDSIVSLNSRPTNPVPEPVGLFADDESVYGVRDLAGSVGEWTADWDGETGVFWVKGGDWADQAPEQDRIAARRGLAPTALQSTTGVRLVVRVLEPAAR